MIIVEDFCLMGLERMTEIKEITFFFKEQRFERDNRHDCNKYWKMESNENEKNARRRGSRRDMPQVDTLYAEK